MSDLRSQHPSRSRPSRTSRVGSRILCGSAALLIAGALAGCGAADSSAAAGSTAQDSSAPAASATDASSATEAATSAPAASGSADAASTSPAAGGASSSAPAAEGDGDTQRTLPFMALHAVVEDHGSASYEGEDGPWHLPVGSVQDTAVAAFDATSADCSEELFSGHPVTCVIHDEGGEGSQDGVTFTAYAVYGAGKNGIGVLFVEGTDPLDASVANLLADPNTGVVGLESGVSWISQDRDPSMVASDVESAITSENAKLAWGLDKGSIEDLTCSDGLTAYSITAAHCSLDFSEGLHGDVTVLPGNWVGAGSEPGPLVIVNGTP